MQNKSLSLYRQLMRRASILSKVNGNFTWMNHVRSEFRSQASVTDHMQIEKLHYDAGEALTLIDSSHDFRVCFFFFF
jgi:hypothetical protein